MGFWWGGGPTWEERTTAFLQAITATLSTVLANEKKTSFDIRRIMSDVTKMQADMDRTSASLENIRGDIQQVGAVVETQLNAIEDLKGEVASLREQLANAGQDSPALEAIEKGLAELAFKAEEIDAIVNKPETVSPAPPAQEE